MGSSERRYLLCRPCPRRLCCRQAGQRLVRCRVRIERKSLGSSASCFLTGTRNILSQPARVVLDVSLQLVQENHRTYRPTRGPLPGVRVSPCLPFILIESDAGLPASFPNFRSFAPTWLAAVDLFWLSIRTLATVFNVKRISASVNYNGRDGVSRRNLLLSAVIRRDVDLLHDQFSSTNGTDHQ